MSIEYLALVLLLYGASGLRPEAESCILSCTIDLPHPSPQRTCEDAEASLALRIPGESSDICEMITISIHLLVTDMSNMTERLDACSGSFVHFHGIFNLVLVFQECSVVRRPDRLPEE